MTAVAALFPTNPMKRRKTAIDAELLAVEHNTAPPLRRAGPEGKYHPHFTLLRPGSCVRCEPSEMNAVAIALRKQIEKGRYPALTGCAVRASRCEDGHARVWALKL